METVMYLFYDEQSQKNNIYLKYHYKCLYCNFD